MKILFASHEQDFKYLKENDHHISGKVIERKMAQREIIVIREGNLNIGWLRYGFFWDLIPMMNMLAIKDDYRRQGWGTKLVKFWESEMKKQGYNQVMTSTLADEQAQHFYRKLGYIDMGALFLPDEALEIIFIKILP